MLEALKARNEVAASDFRPIR